MNASEFEVNGGDSSETTKDEIISALEQLTQESGFIFTLSLILWRDLFHPPNQAADIDWTQSLNVQELSFLCGLMIKHQWPPTETPSEETYKDQAVKVDNLFKKLHLAHNSPVINALKAHASQKPSKEQSEIAYLELLGSGEQMVEAIFYGGSGAYDFQFLEMAERRYRNDAGWLQSYVGAPFADFINITRKLKNLESADSRLERVHTATSFEQKCLACLELFTFRRADITDVVPESVDCFLNTFVIVPGTINQGFDTVGAYNAVLSHPIISLGEDSYFLPIAFNLAQSLYDSPFYWMEKDSQYKETARQHRGVATEEIAYELLKPVFGEGNVYRDVQVRDGGIDVTDIDVLGIGGNKAVIIQAKSKKLTVQSKMGGYESLQSDFQQAVQSAYDQGLISRRAVLGRMNDFETSDAIYLSEAINEAYIVCLTGDDYPAITHQLDNYLNKDEADPYPLAMSIFDLDIVTYYLKDPFDFLYYLRQRSEYANYFKAASEMALLGFHLRHKLFPLNEDGQPFDEVALDEDFAQLIDANFPVERGDHSRTEAADKLFNSWKNPEFDKLVAQVKATRAPGYTDALFYLFDLAGRRADNLIDVIRRVRRETLNDGGTHDASLISEAGRGISFMSFPHPTPSLDAQLMGLAMACKYKNKADEWLALGSVATSWRFVDTMAYYNEKWQPDPQLEEFSTIALKQENILTGDLGKRWVETRLAPAAAAKSSRSVTVNRKARANALAYVHHYLLDLREGVEMRVSATWRRGLRR